MKNRKQRQIISLLLLFVLSAAIPLQAQAEEKWVIQELLTDIGMLIPVQQTPYLLAMDRVSRKWGVFNTDGEELIPYAYSSVSYLSFNCFDAQVMIPAERKPSAPPPLEEINSHALVTVDGTRISDFLYGTVQALSAYWGCGWVLEESTEEDFDCQIESRFYRILRCDLFYLGDHALPGASGEEDVSPAFSLTRDEFKDAAGHGKYLYVRDRQDRIKAYDSGFSQMDIEVRRMDEPMYVIKNWAVMPRGTNEILLDGFSEVKEISTGAGLLLKVTRLDYSGVKWYSVFTLDGEQLMPLMTEDISKITGDYALLTANKKEGLYSFRERSLLLPCAFDKVIECKTALDPYLQHGYLCAEKNGTRYYLHLPTGKMYEAAKLDSRWKQYGFIYAINDNANSRYILHAPDQVQSYVDDSKFTKGQEIRGSGYFMPFTSEVYGNMLVSWHGDRLLQFRYQPVTVTDDDRVITQSTGNRYKLLKIVENE